jgi:hypothetical protein
MAGKLPIHRGGRPHELALAAMNTDFLFVPLRGEQFAAFFSLSDEELARAGVRRVKVSEKPGFPCRVSLEDVEVGETVLAIPFVHHDVTSPYRAAGPIFVREGAKPAAPAVNEIPIMLHHRLLSLRAYDDTATMIDADVVQGSELEESIRKFFGNDRARYLHVHNARPGCFNCRVDRA